MMRTQFDVVVIGTGSAASTVAQRCRAAGWSVAIVDRRPFGGTCALRGCDPKKVLVGAAEALDAVRRLQDKGVNGALRLDWPALMRFKETFTAPVPRQREDGLLKAGITTHHGVARFTHPNSIVVEGPAEAEELEGRFVVIAAGAKPASLHIPGEPFVIDSEQFLSLPTLPPRIVFIGGGYISFEFAHVAARSGCAVTILGSRPQPLAHFDPDLVGLLVEATRAAGIRVEVATPVLGVEKVGHAFQVRFSRGGKEESLDADLVVHGAGRVADLDDLHLEHANVQRDKRGVTVNDFLQSPSNPAVYAAGDAAATAAPALTPMAGYHGQIVAENLLHGNHAQPSYTGVASVVFTLPPLAMVGLRESEARERGLRFRTHFESTAGWYSSRRVGEPVSGFKVLIEEETDRILGAHLLGQGMEEVVNIFALAIRSNLPASALRNAFFAYPTLGSNLHYML